VAAIRIEDRTTGYVGTVEDITKRKQAEETLRQYNLDLQARNEELDAFAHTVAHDLKNLLTMILGYSEVLREDLAAMQLPNVEASLEAIARNSHKMENIIGEILLLAGVRKKEIKLEVLDMADIVAEACQRLTWMVEVQQAEIVLPTTWPTALGYGPWIEEVWVNYLSNGLKYGGLPPHLKLGGMIQDDGMVRFWVGDNGAGLTLEEQARLFSQFTRLDQARTKGHGLGLSIVRRIVEKLGGQVGIESAGIPGQGSTFYFTLPRAG
jgi:signal transduction histidine kinase